MFIRFAHLWISGTGWIYNIGAGWVYGSRLVGKNGFSQQSLEPEPNLDSEGIHTIIIIYQIEQIDWVHNNM